jgi:hypothetical protein
MGRRHAAALLALLATLTSSACSSPTEPAPDYILAVTGLSSDMATFATADGRATILGFRVLLDGQEMVTGSYTYAAPVASLRFGPGAFGVRRGHHALSLQVSSQTDSPTVYQSVGVQVKLMESGVGSNRVVATATLEDQTKSLRTGESIVIEFDI